MTVNRTLLLTLLASAMHVPAWAQEASPAAPAAVPSQTQTPPDEEEPAAEDELEGVVVTGQRQRGAVAGDIPPEITLNAREIRAYGAGTVSELLEALAPQVRSGRGRGDGPPVVLLNGRRISGFSEIRNLPPEAIERVDILPEEVALKYGYRADQRVVNFVLRPRFRAVTTELQGGFATAGGRETAEADINVLRITRDGRWNFDLEYQHSEPLYESERDLIQSRAGSPFAVAGNIAGPGGGEIDPALSALVGAPVTVAGVPAAAAAAPPRLTDFASTAGRANVTDAGPYRTLLGGSDQLSLNGTLNRTVFGDVSATLNARLDLNASESALGLPSASFRLPAGSPFSPFSRDVTLFRSFDAAGPLRRESEGGTGHLGFALNGEVREWRWSVTANYDLSRNTSVTDRGGDPSPVQARLDAGDAALNPFGPIGLELLPRRQDRARTTNQTANAQLVLSGAVFELPAGDVSTTLRADLETRSLDSETFRGGVTEQRELSRDQGGLQANVDIPIASRRREVLARLGDLSANANVEVNRLSDFGTLTTLGYGLNWSPVRPLRLIASVTEEEGAPTIQQLGDPVVLTPNVRVFDFTRGETVDVTRVDGGNPAVRADNRRVMRLGATLRPVEDADLSLSLNYLRSTIEDPIASFPTATQEIEAAFPERFTRNAEGRLVSIDGRPVNFERSEREELRTGLNYSKAFGQPGRSAAA